GGGYLVAGESLAEVNHIKGLLFLGEGVAVPIGLLGLFFGALFIGVKASAPVEAARRKQLEFTADASHELRTPLTVIDAEVGLALSAPRDAARYRDTLERVSGETGRLRKIVEDLLWLARFDSAPPPPAREPIDVVTICEECAERFEPLARARGQQLAVETHGPEAAWVQAPAEWIDRLVAVLVDNACRYTPEQGRVRIVVDASAGRVSLAVEDSGPGIPVEERSLLFDRFHRATDAPGGTGLGLAIADSIVRSTGGRWSVGESGLGGARLEVSWHRPHGRDRAPVRSADPEPRPTVEVH
ncbi:MAG TPA: HAMP domain-containing sensor histidine kinase, partial [Acidimicrobiales bacterium]|nr:HAMP domain-containing sensor histidine kinase [Acidimicrobiales bacterium]